MMLPRHQEPDPDRLDYIFELEAFPRKSHRLSWAHPKGSGGLPHRDGRRIYRRNRR